LKGFNVIVASVGDRTRSSIVELSVVDDNVLTFTHSAVEEFDNTSVNRVDTNLILVHTRINRIDTTEVTV
jgi:hypothetical protein